eukprot:11193723-Ditylum_brightwellii.AAC.1
MSQQSNPAAPIEDLFEQLNGEQDLVAAAGLSYSKIQLVTKAFGLIFKTGVHNKAYHKWNCCPMAGKMCVNFQEHFTRAHHKLHQLQSVARNAKCSVNNIKEVEHEDKLCYCTTEALDNLAETITNDRTAVVNLSNANTDLMQQVVNLTKQSIDDLTAALWDLKTGPDASPGIEKQQEKWYCWRHGAISGLDHTSKNCWKRKEGHQENVT